MTNPRFGFDNLFERFDDGVICTNQQDDHPGANAYDWRPQTYWKPHRLNNLASNYDLLTWSSGASSPPDGYSLTGAGASVARSTAWFTTYSYSAAVTRSGADASLLQSIATVDFSEYVGKRIAVRASIRATAASQARVSITDGVATQSSSFHTGGGAIEELTTAVLTVDQGATNLDFYFEVMNSDGTAYVDSFVVIVLDFADTSVPWQVQESGLYVFPAENQLLRNWLLEEWSDGGLSLPDRFAAITGVPASVSRSADAKVGRFAMSLTGSELIVGNEITGDELEEAKGKNVYGGVWCKTSAVGPRVCLNYRLRDGSITGEVGSGGSGGRVHSGGGAYEWLAVYADVPHDIEGIFVSALIPGGGPFTSLWSGFYLTVSDTEPAPVPHAQELDYMAVSSHNAGTANQRYLVTGSNDNFSTSSNLFDVSPSNDKPLWRDREPGAGPVSFSGYAFNATGNATSTKELETGVLSIGKFFQMPCAPQAPFGILGEKFESEISKTKYGAPLGRSIPMTYKAFDMIFQFLERDFVTDELFLEWWRHAGGTSGKPFYLQWNDGDYPDETFLVWLPDNEAFNPSLYSGEQIRNFRIQLEGYTS